MLVDSWQMRILLQWSSYKMNLIFAVIIIIIIIIIIVIDFIINLTLKFPKPWIFTYL